MSGQQRCRSCSRSVAEEFRYCPHCGAAAGSQVSLEPGAVLGSYTLVRRIGTGGMGVVFEARHTDLGRPAALKVLTYGEVDSEEAAARFRREARLASRLDHPAAVTVHDFFHTHGGLPCLVMELVDGEPLHDVIERDGPLGPARAVDIAGQVLGVLEHAHGIGLVHRDIKSQNIMLTGADASRVKVLDFGIAKMLEPGQGTGMTPLTRTGVVLGSPHFMSPEQARGDPVDGRSDLYSVGVVLYQMLSGHVPFDSTSAMEVLVQHVQAAPPPLPAEAAPEPLRAAIERALAKDPDERYADAAEFRAALESPDMTAPHDGAAESPPSAPAARLLPLQGGPAFPVCDGMQLGRAVGNDLVVDGPGSERVSARHAQLFWRDGELWVRDLDSTNGTWVDGERVDETRLRDDASLRLARQGPAYRVKVPAAPRRQGDGR